jgi:alpha-glucosidase (family GH31 glycosyl hydrolase)
MNPLKKHLRIDFQPEAAREAMVYGENCRFTILTPELIRMEYDPDNEFDNRPSQVVWYRRQPVPDFKVTRDANLLVVETGKLRLEYQDEGRDFSAATLRIINQESQNIWHYGDQDDGNLGGTYRTLDAVDGSVPLEPGILSKSGWALVDDTKSLVFSDATYWLETRNKDRKYQDLYFFGYGKNYLRCLQDFIKICGPAPLIPRWALGNWWSRYWEYTQEELGGLMLDFETRGIPLSVCIIDMDWHIVKNPYTRGWTGYIWNKELFPEPDQFIAWLHGKGLKTALNLHPADGIQPHEQRYKEMAEYLGFDPDKQEPIEFDITNCDFINGYFEVLHNPMEDRDGVDFWWIDWQQGQQTRLEGLDPLWALNHLHFYDMSRNGTKRSFIFSRWGGLGSHRYPIGFSGDTIVSWESLRFQPYFTATASNVGYGWWSHDIGGHCMGREDDELYVRWVQFGVFSPIMRLHSAKDEYIDRRPWGHGEDAFKAVKAALCLRHAMIPYLYTMAWQNHRLGIPLIRPLYYFSDREEAYICPDQYYFGSELMVALYVHPKDPETGLSKQVVWLPEGDWFNFFTGEYYQGDNWYAEYGGFGDIPVFAKTGAIIPMGPAADWGGIDNPETLTIQIFPGADNCFELYEDDGEGQHYQEENHAVTCFTQKWEPNQLCFEILPVKGDSALLPPNREYRLCFKAIHKPDIVNCLAAGVGKEVDFDYDEAGKTLVVTIGRCNYDTGLKLVLKREHGSLLAKEDHRVKKVKKLLKSFKMQTAAKHLIEAAVKANLDHKPDYLNEFAAVLSERQLLALLEVLYQTGATRIDHGGMKKVIIWNNFNLDAVKYRLAVYSLLEAHHRKRIEGEVKAAPRSSIIDLDEMQGFLWNLKIYFSELVTLEYQ